MASKSPFAELLESESQSPPEKEFDTHNDTKVDTHNDTYHDTHGDTKVGTSTSSNKLPSADEVDDMIHEFRKLPKVRANADIPVEWKDELDEYAHQQGVKKYHLVMYAVAKMLGKIQT